MKRRHWKIIIITILILVSLPLIIAYIAFTFYKKEISNVIIQQLKEDYGLQVKISDINFSLTESWPNSTIYLYNAQLSAVSDSTEPFFSANKIGLSFNLKKLLQKELLVNSISIKDAAVQLLVDTAGKNNFTLLKRKDTTSKSNLKFDIAKVKLDNVHFLFNNKRYKKNIAFNFKDVIVLPTYYSNVIKARMQGDMFFDQLLFKADKGPFLHKSSAQVDLNIAWFKELKSIFIDQSSSAIIDAQLYHLSSYIEYKNKPAKLALKITGRGLNVSKTIKLLNNKLKGILSQFNLEGPIDGDVLILAHLGKPREPEIIATITGKKNKLAIGDSKIPYDNVSFTCKVISVAMHGKDPDPENGMVIFKNVKGNIYKFPFTAEILIHNLVRSQIKIRGEINADVSKFEFRNHKLKLFGFCNAKIKYTGPTRFINKKEFLNDSMKLNADFIFRKVTIRIGKKTPDYSLSGTAKVVNNTLKFSKLTFKTKGGDIFLAGDAPGFTEFACGITKGFDGNLKASADYLDITPLLVKEEHKKPKNYSKEISQMKKSDFSFNIDLKARQLRFRKFDAFSADALINYNNSDITVKHLNLNACEGTLSGKARLEDFTDLTADIKLKDMNITTLFQQCENFSQKAITDKNLQGRVSATVAISNELNSSFAVEPTSIQGKIIVKLSDGHLLHYEPLQDISKFIFRNRNFDDIAFTEINETLDFKGTQMTINDFELASNVINLYVNGVYNFRGESRINMRIPWSNLKKRGENYVPKNLGEDGKDAKGLKLNYHGTPGKMKLGLGNK